MSHTTATKVNNESVHSCCFACGDANTDGFGLVFTKSGENQVRAECIVGESYQGYPDLVQGGIVATILDSAMTNCLFMQGIEAMTVRLDVRYRLPVLVGKLLNVEAKLTSCRGRVYELESKLTQNGLLKASASGRFMVPKDAV